MPAPNISRREWFTRIFKLKLPEAEALGENPVEPTEAEARVAVIQGRHCLAYRHTFCSVCVERCPVAGALVSEKGLPRVIPDLCTGCAVCRQVCPAPTNAILLIPSRN